MLHMPLRSLMNQNKYFRVLWIVVLVIGTLRFTPMGLEVHTKGPKHPYSKVLITIYSWSRVQKRWGTEEPGS